MNLKNPIQVSTIINKPIEKVWEYWNLPDHITKWYFASSDWHCPAAENKLEIGEKFDFRMEAKDGSVGFNFWGTYTIIETHKILKAILVDNRQLIIEFNYTDNITTIIETFEPENQNPVELQQQGWQAILNNFKQYAESIVQ
ncbi:MAG: SRPBCC domain-containing protein [Sediminibacterium sp.]|nr:SRPBCC domain-containing protein [Sediminibacterium sp.]